MAIVDVCFTDKALECYSLSDYEYTTLITHLRNFRKDGCIFHEITLQDGNKLFINLNNIVRLHASEDKLKDHLELLNE